MMTFYKRMLMVKKVGGCSLTPFLSNNSEIYQIEECTNPPQLFDPEDDDHLMELSKQFPRKWTKIANLFPKPISPLIVKYRITLIQSISRERQHNCHSTPQHSSKEEELSEEEIFEIEDADDSDSDHVKPFDQDANGFVTIHDPCSDSDEDIYLTAPGSERK